MKTQITATKLTLNQQTLKTLTSGQKSDDTALCQATIVPPLCPPCSRNKILA